MLDHLADVWRFDDWRKWLKGEVSRGRVGEHDVRLLKPSTYMNLSGEALVPYLRDERFAPPTDLLVVVDDVALPIGRFRIRAEGSAGGHNGLNSIEAAVGSRAYARMRIGVGPPLDQERTGALADYVLDRMGKQERATVLSLFPDFVAASETWVQHGAERAMSAFNRKGARKEGAGEDESSG